MNETHSTKIDVLTAEVRVLMVGSRQVTLSVARQLDVVSPSAIKPFGRIRMIRDAPTGYIQVIGSDIDDNLVSSWIREQERFCSRSSPSCRDRRESHDSHEYHVYEQPPEGFCYYNSLEYFQWKSLPLIVLAGLK